jgi:hypothetical protein
LPIADCQLKSLSIANCRLPIASTPIRTQSIGNWQLAIGNSSMSQLKIAVVLLVSILLQLVLREVWRPLSYIDFPLVVVVYIALQRDAWQALLVGTLAGLIVDAASGGCHLFRGYARKSRKPAVENSGARRGFVARFGNLRFLAPGAGVSTRRSVCADDVL